MRSLKEALVHKHMDLNRFEVRNPKLSDLKHLDVLQTDEGYFYVCLEKDKCPIQTKNNLSSSFNDDFEAYRLSLNGLIMALGLDNYRENLICNSGEIFNIVSVYRGLLDGMNYKNFFELWDNLDEKLKDQNISRTLKQL